MSNKALIFFLSTVVAAFVVWMVSDLDKTRDALRGDGLQRDIVEGSRGGFGASAQYDFTFPTPTVDHGHSTAEIGQLAAQAPAYNVKEPGLTDAKFNLQTTYHFHMSRRWFRSGYEMWVSDLVVHFGFTQMTVYISRDYAEGSCQYQAVLNHENQHVAAHRKAWMDYQSILREALRHATGIPMEDQHGVYATEAEGKDRIEKAITSLTDPIFDRFRDDDEKAQETIDSPESYEAVKERCPSW